MDMDMDVDMDVDMDRVRQHGMAQSGCRQARARRQKRASTGVPRLPLSHLAKAGDIEGLGGREHVVDAAADRVVG